MAENVRDAVNAALHGKATPCETACTHIIVGRWTALGIANVIARADGDSHLPSHQRPSRNKETT